MADRDWFESLVAFILIKFSWNYIGTGLALLVIAATYMVVWPTKSLAVHLRQSYVNKYVFLLLF